VTGVNNAAAKAIVTGFALPDQGLARQ
jgi:hypothetical protein